MSKLLHGNVAAHLARLTLPSIGGMFAIMVFNLTDTFFVSQLGTDELAAMGFTFAVVMIVGALAIGFSTGSASIITRAIGAGDRARARRTVSDSMVLTIAVTIVVSMAGYFFITPLFTLLGAEGRILMLVEQYMKIWFLGAVVAIMPPVCDSCLRAGGDMMRPLFVMCTCAVMNIILDPLLIFGLGPFPAMGMQGAALATLISRTFGMLSSLAFLHFRSRLIDWSRPHISALLASWKQILILGLPAALTQALNPIAQGFYLRMAYGIGGVNAVAAMATGTRIENFVFIVALSYGIAIVPFVGHNFGAGAFQRVQQTRRISNRVAMIYAVISFLILLPSARLFSGWFSDDPSVVKLSAQYLIIATLGHAGFYVSNWMSQLLSVIGRPGPVMIINLCRVFLFVIPLSLLGGRLIGFTGLVAGIALGNLLTGIQTYYLTRTHLKRAETA